MDSSDSQNHGRFPRYKWSYDIVFCIDVSASMRDHLDRVKQFVVEFKDDFMDALREVGKDWVDIRTKVITFRDDNIDTEKDVTPFHTMPDQEEEFRAFVNGLNIQGGYSESRSAYEALIEAFKSDWVKGTEPAPCFCRWITVLFTDAPAYPEKLADLFDSWNGLEYNVKRLLIFAPEHPSWEDFTQQATLTIYLPSKAGDGLEENDKKDIMAALAENI